MEKSHESIIDKQILKPVALSVAQRHSINRPKGFIKFKKEDIEQSIASRFEQQVNKYPNLIAVKSKTETFSYDQLNKTANRLARAILSQRGEGKEAIALLLEGASFITSMFGVLKTGKIYVPIDPSTPHTRLTYIVEDSEAVLIVTNNKNLALARELAQNQCQVLNLDDIDFSLSTDNLNLSISPDTLAFIIYTSGSTGKPKGVVQNHRNVLHNCMNNTNGLHISPNDRSTLLYSCGFMGAMRGITNALLNGASLYPLNVKEEGLNSLVNWLIQEEITIYHSVATLFRQFVAILTEEQQFPQLRVLVFGGEPVLRRDVDLYKKYFSSNCMMYVGLGATETGTVRQFIVNKDTQIQSSTVPIGYPVEGMEILLFDEAGIEVGCGEIGEIAVKSEYVALGYWQKPELTLAAFQPALLGGSQRIYRTGDLGRMEPDGCLIHLGRKDFQVKIRGFRIEVSEIEMALLDTDVIKEAVVIAREDIPGDKRLVAYVVVPKASLAPSNSELRRYLQDKVPDYMLPSAFVFLDALPLTPNGKLNRLALPAPHTSQQDMKATFVAPRDNFEQKLSHIWSEVLGIQPIGVKDNFFDLGGNSLLAVSLFAQIENKFGKKLPLATLFQSGTVEALAKTIREQQVALGNENWKSDLALANDLSAVIRQKKSAHLWSSLVKIKPNGSQPPLFFVHPLGGEILCYRDLANHLGSEQPVYGLQPQGLDGEQAPLTSIEDMAAHYIQEIKSIQGNGPYFLGGYSFGGIVAFEMAQQLCKQGEKVGLLVMFDTSRPGTERRSPFLKRFLEHINNFVQQGPIYLQQKLVGWREWGTYQIREKYKRFLEKSNRLPEDDKHLAIIDANVLAQSQYMFQVYPGQMTLLRTDDKNRDDAVGMHYDPQFGWGELVTGGIDIHYISGSHLSLLEEPNVQLLAEKLKLCLEKACPLNNSAL
ncbi:MAG: AMP-binding protein [Tolypothrix brevis GSE-NOS-MK-07-07A]|jgi:amino acid adenylation domain-containing protein|nr:AMP-binding protein [Tolypothrix brevis GSE-NOS-MK-07-07A]